MSNSTLSGANVPFEMNASDMTFTWNNFIEAEQTPGKPNTSGLNYRLPEGRYNGHEAPKVTFTGYVNTTNPDPTYTSGVWGNVPYITMSGLGQLARIGSGYFYYPAVLQFLGSPVDRQNIDKGSVAVMIDSVKVTPNVQLFAYFSGLVPYNVSLTVVSGPV